MIPNPNPPGRPPLKRGEKSVNISLRMTAAQRAKLALLGGAAWVRFCIEKTKMTPEQLIRRNSAARQLKKGDSNED